jgi:hypothetical protein
LQPYAAQDTDHFILQTDLLGVYQVKYFIRFHDSLLLLGQVIHARQCFIARGLLVGIAALAWLSHSLCGISRPRYGQLVRVYVWMTSSAILLVPAPYLPLNNSDTLVRETPSVAAT